LPLAARFGERLTALRLIFIKAAREEIVNIDISLTCHIVD
jgi:hypothetical protein